MLPVSRRAPAGLAANAPASGAVFIFLRSRSTSRSPDICFVMDFPFRGVVRSQVRQNLLLAMLAHPAKALAQLRCEKSRLLEGGEVVALL